MIVTSLSLFVAATTLTGCLVVDAKSWAVTVKTSEMDRHGTLYD